MVIFHKYLRESTEPVKHDLIASQARCTCSMQGEKEHRTPSCFSIKLTDGTASQGWGKSRKTASAAARCSSGNPSPCISLTLTVIRLLRPFLSKSSLFIKGTKIIIAQTQLQFHPWYSLVKLFLQQQNISPCSAISKLVLLVDQNWCYIFRIDFGPP